MERQPDLQESRNNVHALSRNENRVLKDVELEELSDHESGHTQATKKDHSVADPKVGRASLEIVFTEVIYGKHRGHTACRIIMDFTIRSQTAFRVNYATLDGQVVRHKRSTDADGTIDHLGPSIAWGMPRMLDYENKTHPGIKATPTESPEVDVDGVFRVGGVAVTRYRTYTDAWGWDVYTTFSSSDGQKSSIKDCAKWRFMANEMQKDSQCHTFSIEVLVHHDTEPFEFSLDFLAGLLFGPRLRTIGRQKTMRISKVLYPYESPVAFSS